MRIVFWPSGPTNSMLISSGKVCDKPVRVTLTSLTEPLSPETSIPDGYGDAVPRFTAGVPYSRQLGFPESLIVMPLLLENVAAGAADAARPNAASAASPAASSASTGATFF